MRNLTDAKELARLGYIKYDVETGLSSNGHTICLVSDEEKEIVKALRRVFKGSYPQNMNVEVRISKGSEPYVFSIKR